MIWGDQWICGCGWHNLFLRKSCRECGRDKPADAKTETSMDILRKTKAQQLALASEEGQ